MSNKKLLIACILTIFLLNFISGIYPTSLEIFDSEQDSEIQLQSNNEKILAGENAIFYANYSSLDGYDLGQILWRSNDLGTGYFIRSIDLYGSGNRTGIIYSVGDSIYAFYSNGTQKWVSTNANYDYAYGMEIEDFNNDSYEEIAFISNTGRLFVLNGIGEIIFQTPSYTGGSTLATGDLDRDGEKDDIVIGVQAIAGDSSYALMAFIYNETLGNFTNIWNQTAPTTVVYEIDISEIAGGPTLVASTGSSGGQIFVFYGNNGTQKWATGDLGTTYSISFFDQDSDGKEDEIMAGYSGDLRVYSDTGVANIVRAEPWGSSEYEVSKVDLDGDEIYDDILISSNYHTLFAYNSNLTLAWQFNPPHKEFESLYYSTLDYNVLVKNINNDSLDEIIVGGAGKTYWILNTSGNIIGKHYYGFDNQVNGDYIGSSSYSASPGISILNDTNGDGIDEIASSTAGGMAFIGQQVLCKINISSHYREEYMYYNYTSKLYEYYYPIDYLVLTDVQDSKAINWTVRCEKGGYELQQLSSNTTVYIKNSSLDVFDQEDDNEDESGWLEENIILENQNTYFFANYTDLEENISINEITTKPKWYEDIGGGYYFYDLIAADFDGDEKKESFVYSSGDGISAYSAEGTFLWSIGDSEWDYFYDLTSGDFNNDSYEEIAAISINGFLIIIDKDGTKIFQSSDYYSGYSIVKGDLNEDDVKEIVISVRDVYAGLGDNFGIVAFSWNSSLLSFQVLWTAYDGATAQPVEIKISEISNAPNLVAYVDYTGLEKAYVYYGNGTFIYSTADLGTSVSCLDFFDYYEDGTADDLIIGEYGETWVYNSTGVSLYPLGHTTSTGYAYEIESIDYNGDGFENEYIYFESYYLRLNDKTGSEKWNYSLSEEYYGSLELNDLDGDGEKEILFSGGTTGTMYIFNKTGSLLYRFSALFPNSMSGEELATLNNNYFGANTGIDFTNNFNGKKYLGFTAENSNVGSFELYPECIIYFSDGTTRRMFYNSSAGLYYYNKTFSSGDYTWNITCNSINHISRSSEIKTLTVGAFLTSNLTSPENNSYFNNEINNNYSILLNSTVYDLNLNNLTVWIYGDENLINTTYNQTNGTSISYNWTNLGLGQHNWTVIVGNGSSNSTNEYSYFNLINLTLNCEAGGPYQSDALVLVHGNVTDGVSALQSQNISLKIYDSLNNLLDSSNVTSSSLGNFQASFSGLSVGNHTLNSSVSYQGINKNCTDNIIIGGGASISLDKIISLNNITNETISYNISLKLTNLGNSDLTNGQIIDSDSESSPYNIGTLNSGLNEIRSYFKEFPRNSTTYNATLSIATANGTDAYSGDEILSNSSQIILIIPDSDIEQQLTLIKNIYFNSENSTSVNYTITIEVINSGGENLEGITILDSDLDLNQLINLNISQSWNYSDSLIIDKEASNSERTFAKSSATINELTYQSNQIKITIPGYGGPADAIVYALASVQTSTSFDTIITVENQNIDIGQDFIIDYWITNEVGDANYSSGQQTIYVAASGTTNLTATLTSPSVVGNYKYYALVTWVGGTAIAFDSFIVTAPTSESETSNSNNGGGSIGVITGQSTEEIICNSPYIRYGKECCLDENNNSICDKDEISEINKNNSEIQDEEKTQKKENPILNYFKEFFSSIEKGISLNKNYILLGFGILIIISIIFLLVKINKRKSKDITRLKNTLGKEVYAENGDKIGKIKTVYLEKNNISEWIITLDKRAFKKRKNKNISIKHKDVKSLSKIMIIKEQASEILKDLK